MIQAKFNYGPVVRTAQRIIRRFGSKITIVVTNTLPDTKGWKAPTPQPVSTPVDGVFAKYEQKFIDGTLIQQNDQKVIISAPDGLFTPNLVGHIIRNGEKWNILNMNPINPGGTVVIYVAQVRQ